MGQQQFVPAGDGGAIAPVFNLETSYDKGAVFDPSKPLPAITAPTQADPRGGLVPFWAFSSLLDFEKCPHKTYLRYVEKSPQPTNQAADRGTQIHQLAEDFVKGELAEQPDELRHFTARFDTLRSAYDVGQVSLEGEWAFDVHWGPVEWRSGDAWNRTKCDAVWFHNETSATVIDYKTGRKFGNELKHNQQLQLYAITTLLRYPNVQHVNTQLWYIDGHGTTEKNYTRESALIFFNRWDERAKRMTSAKTFPPRPSKTNCKWCPYKETGACEYAE